MSARTNVPSAGISELPQGGREASTTVALSAQLLPPPHLEQPHRLIETLEVSLTTVGEQDVLALGQFPHDVGDQYLSPLGQGGDTGSPVHRRPEQVLVLRYRLPGIQPNPNPYRLLRRLIVRGGPFSRMAPTMARRCSLRKVFRSSGVTLSSCASQQNGERSVLLVPSPSRRPKRRRYYERLAAKPCLGSSLGRWP